MWGSNSVRPGQRLQLEGDCCCCRENVDAAHHKDEFQVDVQAMCSFMNKRQSAIAELLSYQFTGRHLVLACFVPFRPRSCYFQFRFIPMWLRDFYANYSTPWYMWRRSLIFIPQTDLLLVALAWTSALVTKKNNISLKCREFRREYTLCDEQMKIPLNWGNDVEREFIPFECWGNHPLNCEVIQGNVRLNARKPQREICS